MDNDYSVDTSDENERVTDAKMSLANMEKEKLGFKAERFGTELGKSTKDLIEKMLKMDPKERISIEGRLKTSVFHKAWAHI